MRRRRYIESYHAHFSPKKEVADMVDGIACRAEIDRVAVRDHIMSMNSDALLDFLNRLSVAMDRFDHNNSTTCGALSYFPTENVVANSDGTSGSPGRPL